MFLKTLFLGGNKTIAATGAGASCVPHFECFWFWLRASA